MTFNINTFSSQLNKRDTAKQSHFVVRAYFPATLQTVNSMNIAGRELQFRVDSAEIPGRSLQTLQVKPYGGGLTHKVPYDVTYPDVSMSLICGGDLAEKAVFQDWQNLAIGTHALSGDLRYGARLGYFDTYSGSNIEIVQYNQAGQVSSITTLIRAYPVTVNSLPLSWASEDIHRVTVQFAYLHYMYRSFPITDGASLKNTVANVLGNVIGNEIGGDVGNLVKNVANGNLTAKQAVGIAAGSYALKTLNSATSGQRPQFTNDLGVSISTGTKNPFEVALDINPSSFGASPASIVTGARFTGGTTGVTASIGSVSGGSSGSFGFGSGGFSGSASISI